MPSEDDGWTWSGWYNSTFYGRPPRREPAWERDLDRLDRRNRHNDTIEQPTPEPRPTSAKVDALHVKDVDLHIAENSREHRTDQYECTERRTTEAGVDEDPELVIRRGGSLQATITLDRPYSTDEYDTNLIFRNGKYAERNESTNGKMTVDESGKGKFKANQWGANLIKKSGNDITVSVHVPANCAIGEWTMTVRTRTTVQGEKAKTFNYEHPDAFYILFNPWCKDDGTYMEDRSLVKEYVLNDAGCLFRGHGHSPKGYVWNFGQFEDGILEAALFIIRKCFKDKTIYQMNDPVLVSRVIAQVVNNCDSDNGVLWGNWSGDYSDGTSPLDWCGSVRILRQYMDTGSPVKFGQCWVFSGVTTTVCRALGLPARSVTNYSSAHDTDSSCTIDKFYKRNKNGTLEDDDRETSDSVWNYHVWNEAWMSRPDIQSSGDKFGGWQVIDATPQERSAGMYTCGPSPLYAIKHGLVNKGYDTGFTFSEVNADQVHWEPTAKGYRRFKLDINKVGRSISTKIPNGLPYDSGAFFASNRFRLDLTKDYKYKDGSPDSRQAVLKASTGAKNDRKAYSNMAEKEDIEFKLLHASDIPLGHDVAVKLTAKNINDYRRKLTTVSFLYSVQTNTGVFLKRLKVDTKEDLAVKLMPNVVHTFESVLEHDEYLGKMDDDAYLCIQAFAVVKKTRSRPMQNCVKEHVIDFDQPRLIVKLPMTVDVGTEFEANVTFNNPLQAELTNCRASYESGGFRHVSGVKQDSIKPLETWDGRFKMSAKRKGKFTVTFQFSSDELRHLSGAAAITVT